MVAPRFAVQPGTAVPREITLVDLIERRATENGDGVVYRYADYSRAMDGEYLELTWSRLQARVRAVAARIQQVTDPGARVAVLCPNGLDYVVAFFAAIAAGTIAVPLFTPDEPGHTDRLRAVLEDSAPDVILTTVAGATGVREFFGTRAGTPRPRVIAVDAVPEVLAIRWNRPAATGDSIAYLQYTSGSTRVPAGVEITHRAVITNLIQLAEALGLDAESRGVSWLPLFHDMGLLCVILPMVCGRHLTMLSPSAFIRRPYRWIKELGATADGGGVFSAAPNFAYEYAATRGRPPADADLDLSSVIGLINGSEPVTVGAMRRFTETFEPFGLHPTAIKPCYGMAEATLFVAATPADNGAKVVHVERNLLNAGRMVRVAPGLEAGVTQVSCGYPSRSQWAVITDPETGRERPDGAVGEIWLHGANIGAGYWNRPEETRQTFRNTLNYSLSKGSHAKGAPPDARWLRTGDFGAYYGGQLFVTGRVKDLVIVDGRNHYPQDLELSAQDASTALRPGHIAAFTVDLEHGAHLILVAERAAGVGAVDPEVVTSRVRTALFHRHGLALRDLLLVPAGTIPRTSSGKIARRACRTAYIDGTLLRAMARRA
ncbi:AMP-binding protein [Nocardia sp. NBC_00511]|uniref:AMP-binding protein n=1 Tax=Nocardia sp. NBC_00511 TaxID=2903591 RepID=UPI0030E4A62A